MTAIKDLEWCSYISSESDALLAVGWLGSDYDFEKGPVPLDFHQKLKKLCANPWQPFASAGLHRCELCQFEGPSFSANIFVPFGGKIYVAPVGILHYIASHWYKPPVVFINAVLACPLMDTMEYKQALLANGGRGLLAL
jgi:hypothetical protein